MTPTAKGQAVRHPKFGDGVVKDIRLPLVDVLFSTGPKSIVASYLTVIAPTEATKGLNEAPAVRHRRLHDEALAFGRQLIMPTVVCDYTTHVQQNPSLEVHVELSHESFGRFSDWYFAVTREIVNPDAEWIKYVRDDAAWEPRVHCKYTSGMLLPHPVVDAGTVGKGGGTPGVPQFIFHYPCTLENN